jgi:hypothetical protein
MAQFYGTVTGQAKTQGTRRGSKKSGLNVTANGWDFGVSIEMKHDQNGNDCAQIFLTGGSNGGKSQWLGSFKKINEKFICMGYDERYMKPIIESEAK